MDLLLEATSRAERDHFWFRGFRRFVAPLLDTTAGTRRDLTILDCGCGTGANLALLAPYGHVVGIDLTRRGLQLGRQAGRRGLAQASAVQLPFGDNQFDLVTSFDVIYSLSDQDETAAIAEMARVLKPGARLIVNVAALPILRGNHSVLALERRRYTRSVLVGHLARAGLQTTWVSYTNTTLFPLMLGVRLAQRALGLAEDGRQATAEIRVPHPFVNALLTRLLYAEAALVRRIPMPIGSSLLCLAHKGVDAA